MPPEYSSSAVGIRSGVLDLDANATNASRTAEKSVQNPRGFASLRPRSPICFAISRSPPCRIAAFAKSARPNMYNCLRVGITPQVPNSSMNALISQCTRSTFCQYATGRRNNFSRTRRGGVRDVDDTPVGLSCRALLDVDGDDLLVGPISIEEQSETGEVKPGDDESDDGVDDDVFADNFLARGARPHRKVSATSRMPPCFISPAIKSPRPSCCISAMRGIIRRPANPSCAFTNINSRSMFSS